MTDTANAAVHPIVSVVIATRNRKDDLRRALRSAVTQDIPCEILVLDDASTDGTPAMVRDEFPTVRLIAAPRSFGYIVERNRGAQLAKGEFIVSIDDDAEFSTPAVLRQTIADFNHPRIAAVSIPHKDVLISPEFKTPPAPAPGIWAVASYVGTAHAVRRDVFLQLGGYRATLVHNSEERDFCTRLLNFGYVTALGTADPIFHYASPVRQAWRNQMLERRNDICNAVWNVPFPDIAYHLIGTVLSGLQFGLKRGTLPQTVTGYAKAVPVIARSLRLRDPIEVRIYRLLRKLNRNRVLPLDEVAAVLGPAGTWQGRGPGAVADWSGLDTSAMESQ